MNHRQFIAALSSGLDLSVPETKRTMYALKKVIREYISAYNEVTIPYLGRFRNRTTDTHVAYSHYHGYDIRTGLKRVIEFTGNVETTPTLSFPQKDSPYPDIAERLADLAEIDHKQAFMFLCTISATINKEISSKNRIFISGLGLFKSSGEKMLTFKADAGLRRFVLLLLHARIHTYPLESIKDRFYEHEVMATETENRRVQSSFSKLQAAISQLNDSENNVISVKEIMDTRPVMIQAAISDSDPVPAGTGGSTGGSFPSFSNTRQTSYPETSQHDQKTDPEDISHLPKPFFSRENYFQKEQEELSENKEPSPYFEWAVIAIFLIILALGVYLIKPNITPDRSFDNQPFTFTEKEQTKKGNVTLNPKSDPKDQVSTTPLQNAEKEIKTNGAPTPLQQSLVDVPEYQVEPGDTLWTISEKKYNSPWFWPVLYMANKDRLKSPDKLTLATRLVIPSITTPFNALSDTERTLLKKAYHEVYISYKESGKPSSENYLTVSREL